jgi:hypothetical protein
MIQLATDQQVDAAIARVAASPTNANPQDLALVQGAATQSGDRGNRASRALGDEKAGGWGILG